MVREIKFRAQRVDKGWVAGSLSYNEAGCAVIDGWNIVFGTLGQYVGRKDKDGADIYEGDIVRTKSGYEGVVEYNTTYMRYEVRRPDDYDVIRHEDGIPEKDWEVLDNIHNNPHYFDGKNSEGK